jgi:hypothetical protein
VDLGPLEQCAVIDQLLKLLGGDKRVVDAVDLTGARCPGSHGNAEVQVGNAVTQTADNGRFPDG